MVVPINPDFDKLASQLAVLNRPEKLRILALLTEEGQKSITDISNELSINFSTAHKYLTQLERAGLVWSKTIKEDRIKRLFYVRDFNISLNTKSICSAAEVVRNKEKKPIKIITSEGEEDYFNEQIFSRQYLEGGIPKPIVDAGIAYIRKLAYDGITVLEMRNMFDQLIVDRLASLQNAVKFLGGKHHQEKIFASVLRRSHPELLKMHEKGDIFIQNLQRPSLSNFMHDLRGISIHGINKERPKDLKSLLTQFLEAIRVTHPLLLRNQGVDSFNLFILPYVRDMAELRKTLSAFFSELDKVDIHFFLNLDIGQPRFLSADKGTPDFSDFLKGKETRAIELDRDKLNEVTHIVLEALRAQRCKNIEPILKIWEPALLGEELYSTVRYIANLTLEWQSANANYVGYSGRYDYTWKRWMRTARVGEIQNVAINLPRLAAGNNEAGFYEKLTSLLEVLLNTQFDMFELAMGTFLKREGVAFSGEDRAWKYIHIDDSQATVSLVGFNEAIKSICGSPLVENLSFAEDILKHCEKTMKQHEAHSLLRVALKEELSPIIANRFYFLDSKTSEFDQYSLGISDRSELEVGKLHKYLNGGHCLFSKRINSKELLKKEFGLIRLAD